MGEGRCLGGVWTGGWTGTAAMGMDGRAGRCGERVVVSGGRSLLFDLALDRGRSLSWAGSFGDTPFSRASARQQPAEVDFCSSTDHHHQTHPHPHPHPHHHTHTSTTKVEIALSLSLSLSPTHRRVKRVRDTAKEAVKEIPTLKPITNRHLRTPHIRSC